MPAYALTIFIGAFLLFQIQPLIGKYILPWFGGGPGVWTTCLLFFQIVLLAGYTYAHLSTRWLKPRAQVILHFALVAVALALLPIVPAAPVRTDTGGNPVIQILTLLAVCIGLPYLVLSSTGPLLQQWFSRAHPGVSPYRLYALSNVGSLLALVSYPFYFETHFTRRTQATAWGWGLGAYALCCAWCGLRTWRQMPGTDSPNEQPKTVSDNPPTSPLTRILWLLLPACASSLLLATTNKMCQDVAVIPFLWVLPLALYLLSFIICFDSPRWYVRFPYALALIGALAGITWALFEGIDASAYTQISVYSLGLFVCCMVCHGELYRLRPDPRQLTEFYLMTSAGGAVGGLFVAVIAPLVFHDFYEMHWALLSCAALFLLVCLNDSRVQTAPSGDSTFRLFRALGTAHWTQWRLLACTLPLMAFGALDWFVVRSMPKLKPFHGLVLDRWLVALKVILWGLVIFLAASWLIRKKFHQFRFWRLLTCLWLTIGVIGLGVALWSQSQSSANQRVYTSRNFYGVFNVFEEYKEDPREHNYRLQHGRITHGLQFVDPDLAAWPTTYYGESSGVGRAMRAIPSGNRRIGLVGLGTGTLAAYGRIGDYLRIYEINPEAKHLATAWFTFVSNCPARVEIAMGDARLSMEHEAPQSFDLLALDAFSGDAIPVHLLTKEAFDTYMRHLKPDGIVAVHISNHYLDLEPVVVNLARHFKLELASIDHDETEDEFWDYSSTWILLSRNKAILDSPAIAGSTNAVATNSIRVPLWTDDFTAMFQIVK